jgi:NAD(P)-dependent dehydrogenase (short-subunit alcohol dehydrogenase family)
MQLTDSVALVTGSSRGIGKAIAIELAKAGACVIVAARTEASGGPLPGTIGETVEEIKRLGGQAIAIRANLAHDGDVEALASRRAWRPLGMWTSW